MRSDKAFADQKFQINTGKVRSMEKRRVYDDIENLPDVSSLPQYQIVKESPGFRVSEDNPTRPDSCVSVSRELRPRMDFQRVRIVVFLLRQRRVYRDLAPPNRPHPNDIDNGTAIISSLLSEDDVPQASLHPIPNDDVDLERDHRDERTD